MAVVSNTLEVQAAKSNGLELLGLTVWEPGDESGFAKKLGRESRYAHIKVFNAKSN